MTEPLANHTTFRLGGPARRFVEATTEQQLIDAVADCDSRGEPVLVLGGGSNVLIADEGFDGTVVKVATRGVRAETADCAGAQLEVAAGEVWDDFSLKAPQNRLFLPNFRPYFSSALRILGYYTLRKINLQLSCF